MSVSGGTPSITPYTEPFEAVYGAAVGNVAANAIGPAQIQTGSITAAQLGANSVGSVQIANNAVSFGELSTALNILFIPGASGQASLVHTVVGGYLGPTHGYPYYSGISFPNQCLYVWVGGFQVFSDAAYTNEIAPGSCSCAGLLGSTQGYPIQAWVVFSNFLSFGVYPQIQLYAVGY